MAAIYTATGRDSGGSSIVSVTISSIDQDQQVVTDINVVNSVRSYLSTVDGIESVVVRKYEQVITIV